MRTPICLWQINHVGNPAAKALFTECLFKGRSKNLILIFGIVKKFRGVAQLASAHYPIRTLKTTGCSLVGKALGWGSRERRFKSSHPDQSSYGDPVYGWGP